MQPQCEETLFRIDELLKIAHGMLSTEHAEDTIDAAFEECFSFDTLESVIDSLGWTYKNGQALKAMVHLSSARDLVIEEDITLEESFYVANAICDACVCLTGAGYDVFRRAGKPQGTTRPKSSFTLCMEHIRDLCISSGRTDLLEPENTLLFMREARKLISKEDKFLSERIEKIYISEKVDSLSYFQMHEGHGKERTGNNPPYTYQDIRTKLNSLKKTS